MLAPKYLRDFILAIDLTNTIYASAVKADLDADHALKHEEAVAFLENAGDYLKEHGIKDSAEARKRYVYVDPGVLVAQDVKSKTASEVCFLRNELMKFRMAHDDVKKIAYTSDPGTGYEGM